MLRSSRVVLQEACGAEDGVSHAQPISFDGHAWGEKVEWALPGQRLPGLNFSSKEGLHYKFKIPREICVLALTLI